jgi:hypothetical protein
LNNFKKDDEKPPVVHFKKDDKNKFIWYKCNTDFVGNNELKILYNTIINKIFKDNNYKLINVNIPLSKAGFDLPDRAIENIFRYDGNKKKRSYKKGSSKKGSSKKGSYKKKRSSKKGRNYKKGSYKKGRSYKKGNSKKRS